MQEPSPGKFLALVVNEGYGGGVTDFKATSLLESASRARDCGHHSFQASAWDHCSTRSLLSSVLRRTMEQGLAAEWQEPPDMVPSGSEEAPIFAECTFDLDTALYLSLLLHEAYS